VPKLITTDTITAIPAGDFYGSTMATGPGVFVAHAAGPLDPTENLDVQVMVINNTLAYSVSMTTAVERGYNNAGVQTPPFVLPDDTWFAQIKVRHDAATDRDFTVWLMQV